MITHRKPSFFDKTFVVDVNVGMGNMVIFFVVGGEINDFVTELDFGDSTVCLFDKLPVRDFEETELIDPGIESQIGNQTNICSFRGTDRVDTAILARVDVPNTKGSPF